MCDCRTDRYFSAARMQPSDERPVMANVVWAESLGTKKEPRLHRSAVVLAVHSKKNGWVVKHVISHDDNGEPALPKDGVHVDMWREVGYPIPSYCSEMDGYPVIAT
jgi:hypothetical protein